MERIRSYDELSGLLSAQLRRGVVTNSFLSRADWEREIENGLSAAEWSGGLYLLRERGSHWVLNFYLHEGAEAMELTADRPVVTEPVWREKDEAAVAAAIDRLQAIGFTGVLHRLRRTRTGGEIPEPAELSEAEREEVDAFLRAQFDPLTGCLPTGRELQGLLERGELLCTRDEQGISGLLHFAPGRSGSEIRHLAVREDCRGCGMASRLLGAYLQRTENGKSQVWATRGNVPAERFYEKNHYQPDGWQSVILRLERRA